MRRELQIATAESTKAKESQQVGVCVIMHV